MDKRAKHQCQYASEIAKDNFLCSRKGRSMTRWEVSTVTGGRTIAKRIKTHGVTHNQDNSPVQAQRHNSRIPRPSFTAEGHSNIATYRIPLHQVAYDSNVGVLMGVSPLVTINQLATLLFFPLQEKSKMTSTVWNLYQLARKKVSMHTYVCFTYEKPLVKDNLRSFLDKPSWFRKEVMQNIR